MSLFCCDVVGQPTLEYFQSNKTETRIDINDVGHILIWHFEYKQGQPDVIIQDAIAV